jgi:hypothetical protein
MVTIPNATPYRELVLDAYNFRRPPHWSEHPMALCALDLPADNTAEAVRDGLAPTDRGPTVSLEVPTSTPAGPKTSNMSPGNPRADPASN